MEVLGSDKGSDLITNFDCLPPSPPLDSVFDYPNPVFDITPITSPLLPHTSSYNGSYNSPFSQHSELSFSGDDIRLQDFPGPMNEYEPSDFDAPNQPSLLMFTNNYDSEYMSPLLKPQCLPRLLMPDEMITSSSNRVSPSSMLPYRIRYDRRSSALYRTRNSH